MGDALNCGSGGFLPAALLQTQLFLSLCAWLQANHFSSLCHSFFREEKSKIKMLVTCPFCLDRVWGQSLSLLSICKGLFFMLAHSGHF